MTNNYKKLNIEIRIKDGAKLFRERYLFRLTHWFVKRGFDVTTTKEKKIIKMVAT